MLRLLSIVSRRDLHCWQYKRTMLALSHLIAMSLIQLLTVKNWRGVKKLRCSLACACWPLAVQKSKLPCHTWCWSVWCNSPQEARLMSTFFNTLLLAVCIGGAVSLTFIVWIQIHKGWDWGFGIGTIAIFLGIIIFAAGLPLYRIHLAQGTSALIEIIQVPMYAFVNLVFYSNL